MRRGGRAGTVYTGCGHGARHPQLPQQFQAGRWQTDAPAYFLNLIHGRLSKRLCEKEKRKTEETARQSDRQSKRQIVIKTIIALCG